MKNLYAQRIKEFVLSTSTMDQEIFDALLTLIECYLVDHLNITYLALLDVAPTTKGKGLKTQWTSRNEKPVYEWDENEPYDSLTTFAFGENAPIWVVSESRETLIDAKDLRDLWKKKRTLPTLPSYKTSDTNEVRTSVMHPISRNGHTIGLIEFAAKKHIRPTPTSLAEVSMLAEVISDAYKMYENSRAQQDNKKKAMTNLKESLKSHNWSRLALPQLFVAYPGGEKLEENAKKEHYEVIDSIRSVLDQFNGILNIEYWQDSSETGSINDQVIEKISESDFGLCYFSEPTSDEKHKYKDNPNVLFEAGMMHGLKSSKNSQLKAWIPIREKDSGDIPFDIASERAIFISRDGGIFDKKSTENELQEFLRKLIEINEVEAELEESSFFDSLKKRWLSF